MNTDIRLKKITVDNTPLYIQNGSVSITDTTISDIYDSALSVNGGITIKSTENSTSITAGGALSVCGGLSIIRDANIGGSANISNDIRVLGSSVDKFRVSGGNIYASVDGITKHFEITTGTIYTRTTTESTGFSVGSIVALGGVSISNTANSTVSAGGAFSVAGGATFGRDVYSSNIITGNIDYTGSLTLHNDSVENSVINASGSNTHIHTLTEGSFIVNDNTQFGYTLANVNTNFLINSSGSFESKSILPLVVHSTEESTYSTASIILEGGIVVNKMCVVNEPIHATSDTYDKLDKIVLYQPHTSPTNNDTNTASCMIGMSMESLVVGIPNNANMILNYGNTEKFSFNSDASIDIDNSFKIFIDAYNELTFKKPIVASDSIVNIITEDADGNDNVGVRISKNSDRDNWMFYGYSKSRDAYCIDVSGNDTTGIMSVDFGVYNQTYGSIVLYSSGNVSITPTGNFTVRNSESSSIIEGNLSVYSSIQTSTGNIIIKNNVLEQTEYVMSNTFSSLKVSPNNTNNPMVVLCSQKTTGNSVVLQMMSLGMPDSATRESLKIRDASNNGFVIHTESQGGSNKYLGLQSVLSHTGQCSQLILQTSGNIGVGITNPSVLLDVNGSFKCINQTVSNLQTNTISVSSTIPNSISSNGGIDIAKDAWIHQNITIGSTTTTDRLVINNTGASAVVCSGGSLFYGGVSCASVSSGNILTTSTSPATVNSGAIKSYGGLCITNTASSSSITSGCALYVEGDIHTNNTIRTLGGLVSNNYIEFDNSKILFTAYDVLNVNRFMMSFDNSNNVLIGNTVSSAIEILTGSDNRVVFSNTVPSTAFDTASVVLNGGMSIKQTSGAVSTNNGGALTVNGGMSVAKNAIFGGDILIESTSESVSNTTGCLRLNGGLGVLGNVNIAGDTIITGDFTVYGETTNLLTTNTTLEDNVITMNAGPSGSRDSGMFVQRYQTDNDSGTGDVVNDIADITGILGNQTGMGLTSIALAGIAVSSVDDYYVGWWIKITGGFDSNQTRKITAYNGTTKVATVSSAWTSSNPVLGDSIMMYSKAYTGFVFNESHDRFECVSRNKNVSDNLNDSTSYVLYSDLVVNDSTHSNVYLESSEVATTSSGSLYSAGGISVAKNIIAGSTVTVNGVNLTPNANDRFETQIFTGGNSALFQNVSNASFSGAWGVDIFLTSHLTTTSGSYYTNYHLRGVNKNNSWELVKEYVGDLTSVDFQMTTSGQLQYTTNNIPDFTSMFFKWRALAC